MPLCFVIRDASVAYDFLHGEILILFGCSIKKREQICHSGSPKTGIGGVDNGFN